MVAAQAQALRFKDKQCSAPNLILSLYRQAAISHLSSLSVAVVERCEEFP
jgi:hypothetical protein